MNDKERTPRPGRSLLVLSGLVGLLCSGVGLVWSAAESDQFDHQSRKLYLAAGQATEPQLVAEAGSRNLNSFYGLRQYPGSPPIIPHEVTAAFAAVGNDCLACHGKGGYSPEHKTFAPVTPHPENSLCFQCHAEHSGAKDFVESTWQSIAPPRLGLSFLGGSPPSAPHGLQLRENCVACHSGPAAVAEIRVTHGSRGNCRQCHVPVVQQEPFREFTRP
jgi:nitrate reductase (cytochrome), electron transfer subunit